MWMFGGVSTGTSGRGEPGSGRGVSQSCWGGCTGHTGTECPGKPKLGQRKAQGAGQRAREKINCLVFHKSEEFGVSIWGFPFPGGCGVSCSSPLTTPIPTPPHPLTPPPLLSSDVPDARGLREEVTHRHSLCETWVGPDQGRQGAAHRPREQGPGPRSPVSLPADQRCCPGQPHGLHNPKMHRLRIPLI